MSAEPRFPTSPSPGPATKKPLLSLVRDPENTANRQRKPLSRTIADRAPGQRWILLSALTAMIVALLVTLFLSIKMAERQYDLVELSATEKLLVQENEALSQEIEYHQAPQDLAIRASQLGMVASASQATLNLTTGEIDGTASAVISETSGVKNLIAPPALADTQAHEQASQRAEEQRKKEEAEAKASASASAAAASASASASATAHAGGQNQPGEENQAGHQASEAAQPAPQPSQAAQPAPQPTTIQPNGPNR